MGVLSIGSCLNLALDDVGWYSNAPVEDAGKASRHEGDGGGVLREEELPTVLLQVLVAGKVRPRGGNIPEKGGQQSSIAGADAPVEVDLGGAVPEALVLGLAGGALLDLQQALDSLHGGVNQCRTEAGEHARLVQLLVRQAVHVGGRAVRLQAHSQAVAEEAHGIDGRGGDEGREHAAVEAPDALIAEGLADAVEGAPKLGPLSRHRSGHRLNAHLHQRGKR